ncbi:hypothetical protein LINGRAHAP2_LOCUS37585 [Linum grandiflorum]
MPFAPQVSPTEVPKLPIPDDGALSKAAGRARNLLLDWPPPPSYPDRGRKEGDRIKAASAEPTLTSFRIGEQVPTSSSWSGTGEDDVELAAEKDSAFRRTYRWCGT